MKEVNTFIGSGKVLAETTRKTAVNKCQIPMNANMDKTDTKR